MVKIHLHPNFQYLCSLIFIAALSLATSKAAWGEEADKKTSEPLRFKIIGDQEAPAVRYFVPWKTPVQDEMLPIATPKAKPLQVLDPNELRREIDYYSERQTLEQKSTTQNMKAQNSEAGKALINTEAKRTEPE